MKRITNKLALTGSVFSVALLVSAPVSGLALGSKAATAASKTSPFCTNVAADASNITGKMGNLQSKVTQAWSQQDQKLTNDEQQVDQKVAANREQADNLRAADFVKLEAKAITGTQQDAVNTYEAAVKSAVTTRRAVYDAARQTFRDGVQSAISTRRNTVTDQMNTFQTSVNSAISTAEAACASNPSGGPAARTTFVSSLKSARQTFQGERKDDDKVGTQVRQLAQTRNAAFKAADQTLQASLKTARLALSQAFGKSSI